VKREQAFVSRADVQFALRKWCILVKSPIFLAIVGAVSVVSAVNGFSLHTPVSEILYLFARQFFVAGVSAGVASLGILVWLKILGCRFSPVLRYVLAGAFASPIVFVAVVAVTTVVDLRVPGRETLLAMFANVVVTVTAIAMIVGVAARRTGNADIEMTDEIPADKNTRCPDLLRRLPIELGHDIVRLSASDHYVEVYTRLGHVLVLLRFSDALKELGGADGLQIHRSHWVARSAIRRLVNKSRNLFVELDDGTTLPVSRSRFAEIRGAGFPEERTLQ
tara:strand:- start:25671 stop:26504 length:834 start_codon:yes stop_codon:yes gene_type:complete